MVVTVTARVVDHGRTDYDGTSRGIDRATAQSGDCKKSEQCKNGFHLVTVIHDASLSALSRVECAKFASNDFDHLQHDLRGSIRPRRTRKDHPAQLAGKDKRPAKGRLLNLVGDTWIEHVTPAV